MYLTLLVKLMMHHLLSLGLFLEFGSFFHSGLQNRHLQENSALKTYFFWNYRHIPTTLGRLEFAPKFVQNCPLAPGLQFKVAYFVSKWRGWGWNRKFWQKYFGEPSLPKWQRKALNWRYLLDPPTRPPMKTSSVVLYIWKNIQHSVKGLLFNYTYPPITLICRFAWSLTG